MNLGFITGLLDAAAISVETMVWTEGQPEWLALKDKTELYNQLYYISSNGLSVPARPLTDASQGLLTSFLPLLGP